MKPSVSLLVVALGVLSLPAAIHGAAFSAGFDLPGDHQQRDLGGHDGWLINDATPLTSFLVNLNSDGAGGLGGLFDAPSTSHVDLTHSYGGTLNGAAFAVDFALMPSTISSPGWDSFGYSFRDESNNTLLRLAFEPNHNLTDSLEIVYYTASNTRISTGYDLFYVAIYDLAISFAASGADGVFSMVLDGIQLALNVVLPGAGSAILASVGVDFDVKGPTLADAGNNYMIFDDFSVSGPSPSTPPVPSMVLGESQHPTISFRGIPGTSYQILRSTSLESDGWSTEATLTAPADGVVEFVDLGPPLDRAFYRVDIAPTQGS